MYTHSMLLLHNYASSLASTETREVTVTAHTTHTHTHTQHTRTHTQHVHVHLSYWVSYVPIDLPHLNNYTDTYKRELYGTVVQANNKITVVQANNKTTNLNCSIYNTSSLYNRSYLRLSSKR